MRKKNIIAGCVLIAVLIAGIIAVSSIKPAEDNTPQSAAEKTQEVVFKLETADEIEINTEDFDITFVNDNGKWSIEGVSDTSSAKVKAFVLAALSYTSDIVLTGDESEYGLDNPRATIIIKADGREHTVKIGKLNATGDMFFASVDGVKFTMDTSQSERLLNDKDYYTGYSRVSINGDAVTEITIETEERIVELYIPEIERFEGNIWQMRKPYEVMANDTFIDSDVLPALEAVTLSEKAESADTKKMKVTVKADDEVYTFKLGSVADGKISVEYEGETYLEPSSHFAFTEAETFEYMHKLVSYVHIDEVDSVLMEYGDVSHKLETDGKTFTADGAEANADAGKVFYTYLIGVVANGMYKGEELGDRLLKVTFNCKDKEAVTVEYRQINEYTAAVAKNGEVVFVTGLYDVKDLINKIEQFYM